MFIQKVHIVNFKKFRDFTIVLNPKVNIIVGNNEEGKSTILEAIHLALSGMYCGHILKNEISEYLFNRDAVNEYIKSLSTTNKLSLPEILIEIIFDGIVGADAIFNGDGNSYRDNTLSGISFRICFNEDYQDEYEKYITSNKEYTSLPIEYYRIEWKTFAREAITSRSIPIKSIIIDSAANKYQNGSDIYISKIIKDSLDEKEIVALSQSYRTLKNNFKADDAIKHINDKITDSAKVTNKQVTISVDMSVRNSWETSLMTYVDQIPFHNIGKGEQCLIKTNLALAHKKAELSNLILLEEPENHLSHTKLNELLKQIQMKCQEKQIIISTHSNFVANKLNLSNLILLTGNNTISFSNLDSDDAEYFAKLSGYDTLRMILSHAAILVEGPTEELLIQKAYHKVYAKLPIEDGIDVISVHGLAFKRFLSIAKSLLQKRIAVVTDNDGDYNKKITEKYSEYISGQYTNIKICADNRNELKTLEPQFVEVNIPHLDTLRDILMIKENEYPTKDSIIKYMLNHKTEWALQLFNTDKDFEIPSYIHEAINWARGE